ncbi:glycosyltransferase family 4 protein [Clostridium cylindrosporum]|uniref:Mannosyltransferase n=1 Tax=Clostridium cylindrosporum DSM 605 TaxID=1121307 RepID=A0A0J8DEZ3_CLOCY|nr:glycosyltransferase family 1 protein [Clostridium cylindrosporum]KMT22829.1 mannosyltransferase [Clostridium cylindrosporum DSM 605]
MNIGIDARAAVWYRGTGIGTYTYQLIYNINFFDKLNEYLLFLPDENITGISPGENINIKLISEDRRENFWEEVDIPNILNNKEIDTYLVPQNGIGLPKEKKCPFAITLHDVIPFRMPETVGPQYLNLFTKEVPNILDNCDSIITVSNFSKMDIHKEFSYPLDKIHVTHLAAEDIYFPRSKELCMDYIKTHYGIENDFILYVGGFSPRKNILGLIEAYSCLPNETREKLSLVILGKKGRSYYTYRDRAYELGVKGQVIFPGYVPVNELPLFYNACKIFCYPSFYEGFGLPPLEAMACGAPVISSSLTSMPEILEDAAVYIDPYNPKDIYEKLLKLIEDDKFRDEISFKGLLHSAKYNWKKTALETINSLKTLS